MSSAPPAAPCESYPGCVAPERHRTLLSNGIRLRLHEWGDPEAFPVVMAHGMFDHARSFDLIAGELARYFRVISVDARGHGDSGWAASYPWLADVFDLCNVLRELDRKAHVIGHSKGGGQATEAAVRASDRVRQIVNIDGFGPPDARGFPRPGAPATETLSHAEHCAQYLDRRRTAGSRDRWRAYATLDELVERRQQQNPRLSSAWLRYFSYHGATRSSDGWRWKVDPLCAAGGFGPFKPEWIAPGWQQLSAPMLAIVGSELDTWGPLPEALLEQRLSYVPNLERAQVEGAGHFVHIEQPRETARLMLDFLERS